MKLIALSLVFAASIGAHINAPERTAAPDSTLPAASWAPLDTADSLWRRGRIAVADESWQDAAWHFERIATRYPNSVYAGDALYWQAFALQRLGNSSDIRAAVKALETQRDKYPKSASYTSGESSTLLTRLNGRLARGGDSDAAMAIAEIAAAAAEIGAAVAEAVAPMAAGAAEEVAREMARLAPEIQAEVAREMAGARAEVARELIDARADRASSRYSSRTSGSQIPAGCEGVIDDERIEALNALMQMNADQALPILKRVLDRRDKCSEVLRRKAVFLVSQKRSEEAVDILVKVARTDPDSETRSEAVFWLSSTRSERAVDVLEQILTEEKPDTELQKRAIFSLSQARSPRAAGILKEFVKRPGSPVELRGEAIFWLGQERDQESGNFLKEIFPTLDNDELRDKVLFAVAQRKNPENSRWLLQQAKNPRLSGELRKSALFWAGQSGAAVKDLAEIYDTSPNDRELRNQVIFTLSQRRNDSAAIDKLLDIAKKEEDRELRRQALFWLGQSKDPRAAAVLEDIINKPF